MPCGPAAQHASCGCSGGFGARKVAEFDESLGANSIGLHSLVQLKTAFYLGRDESGETPFYLLPPVPLALARE